MRRKPKGSCYDCGRDFKLYESHWVTCNDCDRALRLVREEIRENRLNRKLANEIRRNNQSKRTS